jgi:hypothetical protein
MNSTLGHASALLADEHGNVGASVAAQRQQRATDDFRQQHLAHLAALSSDGQLHAALISREDVGPVKGQDLGDTQSTRVGHFEQHPIALRGSPP